MDGLSLSFLKEELIGDVRSAVMAEVSMTARKILMDAINKQIYSRPDGAYYTRTGDFLNAVKIKEYWETGTEVGFIVWVDGSLLNPNKTPNGEWNQHMDVKGNAFNEELVMVMDLGASSNPMYQQPAHNFYEVAENNMEDELLIALANGLRARGWAVK